VLQVCGVEFESAISSQVVRCGIVEKGYKFQVNEVYCCASKIFSLFTFIQTMQDHTYKSMNLLDTSQGISNQSELSEQVAAL
jgi:hypothetical protein